MKLTRRCPARRRRWWTARLDPQPSDPTPFRGVSHRLGEWPLLLKLAAGTIAQRVERGATVENALGYVIDALNRDGITALDRKSESDRHAAVGSTMAASLCLFEDEQRRRYAELAAFPEDEHIPLRVIAELWDLDEFEAERLIDKLANASLLEFDLRNAVVNLHDVLRAYLASTLGASGLSRAHSNLLDRWHDFHALPHEYSWRWVGYYLRNAGRQEDLSTLLLDVDWLRSKLEATDIDAVIREFAYVPKTHELLLLQDALRLSSHVLAKRKLNLTPQLLARIPERELLVRRSILARASANRARWLRPLRANLTHPGGPLLRTIEGHTGEVAATELPPRIGYWVAGAPRVVTTRGQR